MGKEFTKTYLTFGIALIIVQNSLLIFIFGGTIANLNFDFLKLIMTLTYSLDLIGYGLFGAGLYYLGTQNKAFFNPTQKASQLVFGWIIFSVLWRLLMGVFIPNFYILGKPNIENLAIYSTLPSTVFGIAGIFLLLSLLNLNTFMKSFQKQEQANNRISILLQVYCILHIIGVTLILLGWSSIGKIALDPKNLSHFDVTTTIEGLFLTGLGLLIKILVVPICGIITFLKIYQVFKTIDYGIQES